MADAEAILEAAREAQVNLMVRNDVSKLPLWFGVPSKDTITGRQWVQRVERAIVATGWNDDQTMSFVASSLRGEAHDWFQVLPRSNVNPAVWLEVRRAFLNSYDPARTARTAVNIFEVRQESGESITNYHTKVCKALDDMEALLPAAARNPDPNNYVEAIRNRAAFQGLPADEKAASAANFQRQGITNCMNHVGLQIFVANMKPSIRTDLLKNMPPTLVEAYAEALNLERAATEPKKANSFISVQAVSNSDNVEEQLEIELAAVQTRLNNYRNRGRGGRGGRGGGRASYNNSGAGRPQQPPQQQQQQTSGDYNKCRYCKEIGHLQKFCQKRIANRAPQVDKFGNPFKKVSAVDDQAAAQAAAQQQSANFAQHTGFGNQNVFPPPPPPSIPQGGYYMPPANNQSGYFMPPDFQN